MSQVRASEVECSMEGGGYEDSDDGLGMVVLSGGLEMYEVRVA